MLLSAVSVLVVAQWSSEIPEGLMNNPLIYFVFSASAAPIQFFSQLTSPAQYAVNSVTKYVDRQTVNFAFVESRRGNSYPVSDNMTHQCQRVPASVVELQVTEFQTSRTVFICRATGRQHAGRQLVLCGARPQGHEGP